MASEPPKPIRTQPPGVKALKGMPWTATPIQEFLGGTAPPELAEAITTGARDRKGLTATTWAVLQSQADISEVRKALADPTEEEKGQTAVILEALEQVLATQQEILAEQRAIRAELARTRPQQPGGAPRTTGSR